MFLGWWSSTLHAPTTFTCLMKNVRRNYLHKFLLVFVDDILVYSKTKEEHEDHRKVVLQLLREHKIYTKINKCEFFQTQVHYLGHAISKEGMAIHLKNIKAIMEWPTP